MDEELKVQGSQGRSNKSVVHGGLIELVVIILLIILLVLLLIRDW